MRGEFDENDFDFETKLKKIAVTSVIVVNLTLQGWTPNNEHAAIHEHPHEMSHTYTGYWHSGSPYIVSGEYMIETSPLMR